MITEVSLQYAKALFELAGNTKCEDFYDNLKLIEKIIINDSDVLKVFEHPKITSDEKKKIIKNTLDGKVDNLFIDFLLVVIDHGRVSELANIEASYKILLDKYHHQQEVEVFSKYALTKGQLDIISNKLKEKYCRDIVIHEHIDHELVGGIKITVNNEIIDGTALSLLQNLKDKLKG